MGFVLFALALVAASAWWWGPPAWRELRRSRVLRRPFPPRWRAVLRSRMPAYARLPPDLQQQVRRLAQVFIAEKPFVGCAGLTVTDEMRVLVAAQAALLQLNRPAGGYPGLRQVLMYPGAFVVDRPRAEASGLVHEERRALSGESWQEGQVVLSWDDVVAGAADPADGQNVVIHEFAHQLDAERGRPNGAPVLGALGARYERWAVTWNAAWDDVRARLARGEPSVIGAYGASNPAEFFAVASERFFECPQALADEQPAVYRELVGCYAVDPLSW